MRLQPLPAGQQRLDLGAVRRRHAAAQPRAFEARRRGRKAHRRFHVVALGEREREGAVENVAGAERVDRIDRKHRACLQRLAVAPEHVVRAVGDGEKRSGRGGDPPERGAEVVETGGGAQALAREHHMGGDPEQVFRHPRRPVGVEHHGDAARPRRQTDRPHEVGKAVVGQHGVGGRNQAVGIGRRRRRQPVVAIGHDHPLAARVDEDRGERRGHARNALAGRAVDLLARERGQHPVAVRVLAGGAAERAGQRRPSAQPGDRDRGVGGAAAVDGEEILSLGFAVRLREALDPEDLVEHDDAGAEDVRRARGWPWVSAKSTSSSTQARMM